MKLSIITINYNNAEGLRKTLASVAAQTYADIEHIIVDGGSTDNSVEVIREYEQSLTSSLSPLVSRLKWISEPDKGIYNAMNKGLEIALGKLGVTDDHHSIPLTSHLSPLTSSDYIQILNSGDILAANDVTEKMLPKAILNDYDMLYFPINQYKRLKRYKLWHLVYFIERVLFKLEKWGILSK